MRCCASRPHDHAPTPPAHPPTLPGGNPAGCKGGEPRRKAGACSCHYVVRQGGQHCACCLQAASLLACSTTPLPPLAGNLSSCTTPLLYCSTFLLTRWTKRESPCAPSTRPCPLAATGGELVYRINFADSAGIDYGACGLPGRVHWQHRGMSSLWGGREGAAGTSVCAQACCVLSGRQGSCAARCACSNDALPSHPPLQLQPPLHRECDLHCC